MSQKTIRLPMDRYCFICPQRSGSSRPLPFVRYGYMSTAHALAIGGKAKKKRTPFQMSFLIGAGGGGRTRTVLPPRDFESRTSASSITPAHHLDSIAHFLLFFNTYFSLCHQIIQFAKNSVYKGCLFVAVSCYNGPGKKFLKRKKRSRTMKT